MKKSNNSVISLIHPVKSFMYDASELFLDEIIFKIDENATILKSIPAVKWLMIGNDIRNRIQAAAFIKKYSAFIGPISEDWDESIYCDSELIKIFDNKNDLRELIDNTIIALDRYQNVTKAKILGTLFKETFKNYKFTIKEYNELLYSIDLIHPVSGINC